ncbi:MAG: S1 RNA-binding domain-containing protein [Lachnospiraceae bacterium]|nr:S1 RNA-binding domain-containing protein [Lachnospiraceae bacterium]
MSEEIRETIVNEAAEAAAEVAAEAAPAVEEAAPAVEEAAPAAEEAAPAAEEAKEAVPSMDDFADAVDKSMRKIEKGDLVEGVVTGVSDSEITVDLQYYAEGVIRPLDYSGDPNFSLNDVHVGDEVKAIVLRTDDGRGNIQLSRRAAMEKIAWDDLKSMMDNKDDTEIKITATTKGGVVGFLNGIRAFIPASQLALSYVENLDDFIGKVVPARVITATEEGKKLVLSCRDILKERRDAEKAERISNIQPGLVTEGKVQSLQSYGAFVSLGDGVDGLVHISQISSGGKRLKHAKEALEVGQTVKVKVIKVENGRISLSMRALEEAPAKPVEEEKVVLPKSEKLTTSLGSLLGNIKLD